VSDALQVVSRPEGLLVASRVKEFVEISEHTGLNRLITCLQTIQSNLPEDAGAKLQLRGDEVFGRRLSISYFREQTQEEAECEGPLSASDGTPGSHAEHLGRSLP
jgi:hypothetical protein